MPTSPIQPGDIFTAPLSNDKVVYGQILYKNCYHCHLYACSFRTVYSIDDQPDLLSVTKDELVIAGRIHDRRFMTGTSDTEFKNGEWKRLGNIEPEYEKLPQPYFIRSTRKGDCLCDFFGRAIRAATTADKLYYGRDDNKDYFWQNTLKHAYENSQTMDQHARHTQHLISLSKLIPRDTEATDTLERTIFKSGSEVWYFHKSPILAYR